MAKQSELENQQWNDLYQYIKREIFRYDDKQNLSKNLILRLKGLRDGKFMANNKIPKTASYSYEVILFTFKLCKNNIIHSLQTKQFNNESNKINYIMKIIENNINDVYIRIQNAEKSKNKIANINVDLINNEGAIYTTKTPSKINTKLDGLW